MIKVKIQNAQEGRNEPTFRPLLMVSNMLRDYHIDITESDSYDYLFVGMNDFIDKSQPFPTIVKGLLLLYLVINFLTTVA